MIAVSLCPSCRGQACSKARMISGRIGLPSHRPRTYAVGMDVLDQAAQPTCPKCGTVLRDAKTGYVCVECNQAYLPNVPAR